MRHLFLSYFAVRSTFFEERHGLPVCLRLTAKQIYFTGCQALRLVTFLALATDAVILANIGLQSTALGAARWVQVLYTIAIRELGPLMVGLVVIARSGTAIASEVGNMKAYRELDALDALAISPLSLVVFPRVIGGIISVFCLTFYFSLAAAGGIFFAGWWFSDMTFGYFLSAFAPLVTLSDVGLFLVKSLVNGYLIFAVACHQGLSVKQSPHEVPQVTTRAVVTTILLLVVVDCLLRSAASLHLPFGELPGVFQ